MAATRVRLALASLACSLAGVALLISLPSLDPNGEHILLWILLLIALEGVAVVLGNRSLQPDPKGGPWRWLALTAFFLPVVLLFLPCALVLLPFLLPGTGGIGGE